MNLYLIDYENVTDTGFMGVKELTAEDTVIVFYSQHTKNISFERHIELSQSPAHFEYIKILKTGKNYLDFQLSTYLGFLIGKDKPEHVYIITNDTGYDSVIDFWSDKNIDIIRQKSIVPPGSTLASGKYSTADGRPEAKARCRFSTDLIGRIDIRSTDQTGHIRKENKGFRISGSSGSMAEKGADGSQIG